MKKTVRVNRENILQAIDSLGRIKLELIEARATVKLLEEERAQLIRREVDLTIENTGLRREIAEVAEIILRLNERMVALVRRPPVESEPVCWFQLFPVHDTHGDALAVQTSNADGDNWLFGIPLTEDNAVLLSHLLDGSIPTPGIEVPQRWLYEALHEALDPIVGDGDGGVARNFLHWVDARVGVN